MLIPERRQRKNVPRLRLNGRISDSRDLRRMPNENCLEGIQCPHCGSDEPFEILVTAFMRVTDEGTDDYHDVDWDDSSRIQCLECRREGCVRDFKIADK